MNIRNPLTIFALVLLFLLLPVLTASAQDMRKLRKLYTEAGQAHADKDYKKAIELYKQVVEMVPTSPNSHYNIACAYSLLGEKENAIKHLKLAIEQGYSNFGWMQKDSDLDAIRDEAGYKELFEKKAGMLKKRAEKKVKDMLDKLGGKYECQWDHEYKFAIVAGSDNRDRGELLKFMRLLADSHWKTMFDHRNDYYIVGMLASKRDDFVKLLGERRGRGLHGMYDPGSRVLYLAGLASLSHEFTHALHFADMSALGQSHAAWMVEGFGTLFESGDVDEKTQIVTGTGRNRLRGLKAALKGGTCLSWDEVINMGHGEFQQRQRENYFIVRFMFYYLQEKGLLKKFYDEYTKNYKKDPQGGKAFANVLGESLEDAEKTWRKWVMDLKAPGRTSRKPMMGVKFDDSYEGKGLWLDHVEKDSPAERAGMKIGDIIIEMDGKPIEDLTGLRRLLGSKKRGDKAVFKVQRGEKKIEMTLELGVYTDDEKPPKEEPKDPKEEPKKPVEPLLPGDGWR